MLQSQTSDTLLLSEIRDQVEHLFRHRPCLWHCADRAVVTMLKGFEKLWEDKDFMSRLSLSGMSFNVQVSGEIFVQNTKLRETFDI
jgi:hypothetical protein